MVSGPSPFAWTNSLKLAPSPFPPDKLAALRSAVPGVDNMGISLVDISSGSPTGYALNYRKTGFAASLPKIAAMFAAFYLQERLRSAPLPLIGMSLAEVETELRKEWRAELKAKVPRSVGDFPDITSIFGSPSFDFSAKFQKDMELMMKKSDNSAAGRCIHRIGYDYLNGSLVHAGLYSVSDSSGLWLAGDYVSAKDPSNRDGKLAPGLKSGQAASAEAVTLLLANLGRDELISATASQGMRAVMSNASTWVHTVESTRPGAQVYGKVGLMGGKLGSSHDCALVKYHGAHYVVVGLFGAYVELAPLFRRLDLVAEELFAIRTAATTARSLITV